MSWCRFQDKASQPGLWPYFQTSCQLEQLSVRPVFLASNHSQVLRLVFAAEKKGSPAANCSHRASQKRSTAYVIAKERGLVSMESPRSARLVCQVEGQATLQNCPNQLPPILRPFLQSFPIPCRSLLLDCPGQSCPRYQPPRSA